MSKPITVGSLVEQLRKLDQSLPVYFCNIGGQCDGMNDVGGVREALDTTGKDCIEGPNYRYAEILRTVEVGG